MIFLLYILFLMKNMETHLVGSSIGDNDMCLADSASTHTILKDKKFFSFLIMQGSDVNTISSSAKLIEGSGRANILLPRGTKIHIDDALYSTKSQRNLLSFKDIRRNGYHIETTNEDNTEYLYITDVVLGKKNILEKLPVFSSGLYYTNISTIEAHAIVNQKFTDENNFIVWHDRLGHPGSIMMRRIIKNSSGHSLKNQKIFLSNEFSCAACSQGKLIIRSSPTKIRTDPLAFLQRIQGDICGPIHPPCGPFRYFMILIDASTRWSHVCLLSTRNQAFARLLAQIIRLRAHFPVAYVHTQNSLAELFIKRLQLIARPLLMRTKLPTSAWGHAILHAAALIRIRPTNYHEFSHLQLVFGREPNISHLRIFGCAVYVSITPPQRTKMGPQRRLGIYVGYESP